MCCAYWQLGAAPIATLRVAPRLTATVRVSPATSIFFKIRKRRLETAAQAEAKALTDAGLKLKWKTIVTGKREAEVEGLGGRMPLNGER